MRRPIDLDLRTAESYTVLVHGIRNVGKTHFVGDALRDEAKVGPVRFLNILGEDGEKTLAHHGLGKSGETVENIKDFDDALADCYKLKLQAVGLDSIQPLALMCLFEVVGADRLPDGKNPGEGGDGERSKALWAQGRIAFENRLKRLRGAARYVIATCPSDKSVNEVTGEKSITPDLFGKSVSAAVGSFDFVGYMDAKVIGPGKIRRALSFAPSANISTKQRLPIPILRPIIIPDGGGGWAAFRAEVEKSLTGGGETGNGAEGA